MEDERFFAFVHDHMDELSLIIAALSAFIAAIATVAALMANRQSKKQYMESIQPQLSMSLVEFDSFLYLRIKNTGGLAAKNIEAKVKGITNNGTADELILDDLFVSEFELYPEEVVQGRVAIYGKNMVQSVFPQIEVFISYRTDGSKKKTVFSRTVTYFGGYTEKVAADVNLNTRQMEDALKGTARASTRIANYLDGRQVGAFDELNILAGRSLRNDLIGAFHDAPEPVLTRTQTIIESKTETKEESHADT